MTKRCPKCKALSFKEKIGAWLCCACGFLEPKKDVVMIFSALFSDEEFVLADDDKDAPTVLVKTHETMNGHNAKERNRPKLRYIIDDYTYVVRA